ncbi:MAG: response regulator [Pseudomonadota bacterium]
MHYEKHLLVLEALCVSVFENMAHLRTESYVVKATRQTDMGLYVAGMVAPFILKGKPLYGLFALGLHDRRKALRLASLIARGHGLAFFKKFDNGAAMVVQEYIAEVMEKTAAAWALTEAHLTLSPAKPLAAVPNAKPSDTAIENHIITLTAAGEAISLFATFQESVATQLMGKKVLVADDSRVIRMVLAKEFVSHGCVVVEAADGNEAVAVFLREKPDLTIMDLVMPQMSGLNAIAAIRKASAASPIIVLTSSAKKSEIMEAASLGIRNYVKKPIKPASLIAAAIDCFT